MVSLTPMPAGGRKGQLRIRRTWRLTFGAAARRAGVGAPYKGVLRIRRAFAVVQGAPPIPSPSGGGCRPQGRPERENVAGLRCGNDRSRGGVRTILPSASGHALPLPSSASRGIGGCHLPPEGEGKGRTRSGLVGGGVPTPPQHTAMACFCLRQIRTHPVGNAVPGVPRSSTQPKQSVGRIRTHPVGRADPGALRSNTPVFHNFGRNRK